MRTTVLLVNLGSPDSPSVSDVRRYLREFLSDARVLDSSWLVRQFVLNVFILPFRPTKSAEAYRSIWSSEGFPLILTSRRVQALLREKVDEPVELAMRYGHPSIPDVVRKILRNGVERMLLIPLYPHYAMSSYETVVERVKEVLAREKARVQLKVLPPFYDDPYYITALVEASRPHLKEEYDHLLFSFHGLPERHLRISDSSKSHCLVTANCCATPHPAHATCYRFQVFRTVQAFVKRMGIAETKYSIAFQSRLGRDPWLKPYTDQEIERLAERGIKRLAVLSPAFVSDCLETLEELGLRGRETFLAAGGQSYTLVPCLNDHPLWIEALKHYVERLRET